MSGLERDSLCGRLSNDKIKISGNSNPVKMKMFLSFLTVSVEKITDHLGSTNGWTRYYNKEHDLIVSGGIVHGNEYLDSIKYGKRLANPYNNFVNPLYLKGIMTDEGKSFFVKYYEDEIFEIIRGKEEKVHRLKRKLQKSKKELESLKAEHKQLLKQYEVTI